ncbi:hypothetical protein NQ315_015525 [Exocentrus adspersus]|uniref:Uncharacterized protein n=1 Tax=Exocentrus adspersus TaxID=1586481 RepID=A0AAV8VPH2_9CUCU|nr:hypothetical protein NQ315_015525 [Exocentrus adspersus]
MATVNDVAINSVTADDNTNKQQVELIPQHQPASTAASTVEISGISTGAENTPASAPAAENPPFKPQRAGSMFARFIDDIFQSVFTDNGYKG